MFPMGSFATTTILQLVNAFSIATSTTATPIFSINGSDGRIGIGTRGPGKPLHVYHATINDVLKLESGDEDVGIVFSDGVSGSGLKSVSGAIQLYPSAGASTGIRIDTSGNVGIGTTTPNHILQIAGNAGPQLLLTQPSAGLNLKHWYASTTAGSLTFGTLNDNLSTLTERLRIGNDGRMGIGTTTPTTMFQVATSTANATTTVEFGKASQNKGSCLKLYDSLGAVYYCRIDGGIFTCNTTTCE